MEVFVGEVNNFEVDASWNREPVKVLKEAPHGSGAG